MGQVNGRCCVFLCALRALGGRRRGGHWLRRGHGGWRGREELLAKLRALRVEGFAGRSGEGGEVVHCVRMVIQVVRWECNNKDDRHLDYFFFAVFFATPHSLHQCSSFFYEDLDEEFAVAVV